MAQLTPTHLLFPFPFQKFQAPQDPEEANQDLEEVKYLDEAQDLEEIQDLDKVEDLEEVEDKEEVKEASEANHAEEQHEESVEQLDHLPVNALTPVGTKVIRKTKLDI